jgi:hypothetical protein
MSTEPGTRSLPHIISAALLALITLLTCAPQAQAQVAVLTQHNDNSRTGANLHETILNPSNVNVNHFGKLFTLDVDGEVYAQPLIVPKVTIPGKGVHNVVYVATMNDSLYAFDADRKGAPLWQKSFGTPIPASDVQCCCPDISTSVGILGTPVIDVKAGSPTANTIWFVSQNKNSDATYHNTLWALDITTGATKGSVEIAATFGAATFDPKIQNQRPAVTLQNGVIFLAWSSHNDCYNYHGWVMGYDAATLTQVGVYANTPNGTMGGIWQGGQGLTVDPAGNLYFLGGNGTFDADSGGADYGLSAIRLNFSKTAGLQQTGWFTPYDVANLNGGDLDLGSAGLLAIPGTNYLVGGGKEGKLYLLDSTASNLGSYTAGSDNVPQSWAACNGYIMNSPVYYNSPANGPCIYVWSTYDQMKVFQFNTTTSQFNTTPIALSPTSVPPGEPGAMLSISANGSTPGTGIVWASHPYSQDANNAVVNGIVHAYDASQITTVGGQPQLTELWNSKMNAARDDVGNFAKFCPPTVANGKLYMASFGPIGTQGTGQLVVYGAVKPVLPSAPALAGKPGDGKVALTWNTPSGAVTYNLYRGATSGGETLYKSGLSGNSAYDTGLTNGSTYYYQLTAVNTVGESKRSKEIALTPQAGLKLNETLAPTDDAYVQSGANAGNNYGNDPLLIVKINPPDLTRHSYVKFDLTQLNGQVTKATLRLYGSRQGTNSMSKDSAYEVTDTTWTQGTITWNNAPALGNKLFTETVTSTPKWYSWDVTAWVKAQQAAGAKLVSLAVAMDVLPADGYRDNFTSTRGTASQAPQLIVAVGH